MGNRAFDPAMDTPLQVIYRYDNVVFKVGNFFSQQGGDTLKDILERAIKREAMAKIRTEKV